MSPEEEAAVPCLSQLRFTDAASKAAVPYLPGNLLGWQQLPPLNRLKVAPRGRRTRPSICRLRDDADVEEVVGIAQMLAQPLQRGLQHGLDPVDHHLAPLLSIFRGDCGRTDFSEEIAKCMQLSIGGHRAEELLYERPFSCGLLERKAQGSQSAADVRHRSQT